MPDQTDQNVIQAHRLNSIAVMGTVVATDYEDNPGKVTVKIGPTDESASKITVPFLHRRGGNDWEWWAPEKDEQVLIVAPGGNLQRAVIVGSLPYKAKADFLTPSEKGKRWVKEEAGEGGKKLHSTGHVVHYQDKTTYSYDKELHIFQATFLEGKTIDLKIDATKDKEKIDLKTKEIKLNIDAAKDAEKVTLDVKDKTKLVMDAKEETITIDSKGKLDIKAKDITLTLNKDGSVALKCKKLTVESSGEIAVTGTPVNVNSSGNVNVKGGTINLNC